MGAAGLAPVRVIVIDASVWISTLRSDEVHRHISLEWSIAWTTSSKSFSVPAIFPPEVAGALGRLQVDRQAILKVMDEMLSARLFTIHPIDFALAERAAHLALDTGIRGADALYVTLAQTLNVPLVTWDREQLERTGQIVDAITPAQALERMA
jgi:predicted nucleic acid-binding protein